MGKENTIERWRVEFVVPGDPRGKQRPRLARGGATYTPRETVVYEKEVRAAYYRSLGREGYERPHDGPVAVSITAYYGIPKSATKAQREKIARDDRPLKKPDVDNVEKIIMDALNGVAYEDDKQVTDALIRKRYAPEGEEPRVVVKVAGI